MPNALKPCPFCGGVAEGHSQRASEDSEIAWVECTYCEARTCMFEDAYAPHAQAIDAWNRRGVAA